MKLRAFGVTAAALVILGGAGSATALDRELEVVLVDTSGVPDVEVTVAAPLELSGTRVPASAFSVTQDGKRRDVDVLPLPSEQLEVALVIDTSGSMKGPALDAAKAAAEAFVQGVPDGARVAVVGFGAAPVVAHPLSSDVLGQIGAIRALVAAGETALYDAVATGIAQLDPPPTARPSIVVLSDGGDTASRSSLNATIDRLEGAGMNLYVIELVTVETDHQALVALTQGAGGRLLSAGDPTALRNLFDAIGASLVNQYRLTFRAEGQGPTELRIRVRHGDITAEAVRTVDLAGAAAVAEGAITRAPGGLAGPLGYGLGAASVFVALLATGLMAMNPGETITRLSRFGLGARMPRRSSLGDVAERATRIADRALESGERRANLTTALERAGIALSPAELVARVAAGAIGGLLLGLLLGNVLVSILFAAAVVGGAKLYVSVRTTRRQQQFADQLSDTLQLLAGSLRVGYGLLQAIDSVSREAESPTSDEFRRLTSEVRLGRDVGESLEAIADRVTSEDFEWVVQAILIHREVGGDLAEVLDRVGETIRDRGRLFRQVKALSAEGRLSAVILFVLPLGVAAAIGVLNPGYLDELFRGAGLVLLCIGIGLMVAGGLWLRRIVRPEF